MKSYLTQASIEDGTLAISPAIQEPEETRERRLLLRCQRAFKGLLDTQELKSSVEIRKAICRLMYNEIEQVL